MRNHCFAKGLVRLSRCSGSLESGNILLRGRTGRVVRTQREAQAVAPRRAVRPTGSSAGRSRSARRASGQLKNEACRRFRRPVAPRPIIGMPRRDWILWPKAKKFWSADACVNPLTACGAPRNSDGGRCAPRRTKPLLVLHVDQRELRSGSDRD